MSLFYLRGESNDRTRMESWMDAAYADDGPGHVPAPAAPRKSVPPAGQSAGTGQGTLFDSFLSSKQFQELLHATVLDTLRSPEGQELIARVVRKELLRQR